MGKEIERKFLVDIDKIRPLLVNGTEYKQGYMTDTIEPTIRARVAGDKGFLTVKGKNDGCVRDEFEYEIPKADAEEMLNKYCPHVISKTRYCIPYMENIWEVDVFKGSHGMVVAEVEIDNPNVFLHMPEWITYEVTNDPAYYNSNIAKKEQSDEKMVDAESECVYTKEKQNDPNYWNEYK